MPSLPATFAEDVINQPARAQFEAFLDEHRGELNRCLDGLTEEQPASAWSACRPRQLAAGPRDGILDRWRPIRGDRSRASTGMTSCDWPSSLRMSKQDCSRVTRGVPGATPAGSCAGRCVRGLPSTIWTERMASRTSTSGLSTPSAATGHSRIGGGGQRITARRNSGDIQMTRHRSQAVASTCSGDRSMCRLTPNRPKFCVTISLQRGPALRKNWRQKRSSSSTPNSSPVRSSGLRPVP